MGDRLKGRRIAVVVANEGVERVELTRPVQAIEAEGGQVEIVATEAGEVQTFDHLDAADVVRDLHTESYAEILAGRGFGVEDVRPSLELRHRVRHDPLTAGRAGPHPLVQR